MTEQHTHSSAGSVADGLLRERIAINLWHKFAPEHHMEWEEETHQAEYLLAADDVLFLTRNEPQTVWIPIETAPKGPAISVARKGGQRDDGSTYWYQAVGHYDPNLGHFHKSYGELYGEPEVWARYPENPEHCPPVTRPE
jgi:hypothetical protein